MGNNKLYTLTFIAFSLSSIGWLMMCIDGIFLHIKNKMIFGPESPIAVTSVLLGILGTIAYITFIISLFKKPRVKKYLITNLISLIINFLLFCFVSILFIGV